MRMLSPMRLRVLVLVSGAITASLGAAAWKPTSICSAAMDWPAGLNVRTHVTLKEMAACNLQERKMIFRHLSTEQQKALWLEHWQTFLTPGSKLSPAARAAVMLAMSHVDQYFTLDSASLNAALRADGFEPKRIKAQLGDSVAIALFAILGPDKRFTGHNLAALLQADNDEINSRNDSQGTPYCSCATGSGDFCCQGTCQDSFNCITSGSGCGWIWVQGCSGLCGP